jgi:hypothetical protein
MAIVNITTETDADFIRSFAYQYTPSNLPVDLTGNTMRMGVRKNAADVAEVLLLTTENGLITITDPANGLFTVWMKQADLERLPIDTYDHSLVRNTGTLQLRIWSGTLTNTPGPSR